MMHFPTSLPRMSTGSPAAKVVVDPNNFELGRRSPSRFSPSRLSPSGLSPHPVRYDGPMPPIRDPRITPQIPPRPAHHVHRPQYSRKSPLPSPVYALGGPSIPWSNTASRDTLVSNEDKPEKATMSGALPNKQRGFFGQRNQRSKSPVDGVNDGEHTARKSNRHKDKSKPEKHKPKAVGLGKMFKKKGSLSGSKSDVSLLSQLPQELQESAGIPRQEANSKGDDTESFLQRQSRRMHLPKDMRTATRSSNVKEPSEGFPSAEDPFHGARKRLSEQRRMRKMRRARSSLDSKEDVVDEAGSSLTENHLREHGHEHEHEHEHEQHLPEGLMRFSRAKEKLAAYHESRELEKGELEEGVAGSRMGNAMRRMSAQLMPNSEEKDASSRRVSRTDEKLLPDTRVTFAGSTPTSPDTYVDSEEISPATITPDTRRNSQMAGNSPYLPPKPPAYIPSGQPMYGVPPAAPRGGYPNRPAMFYRPTLSPVSSRSPVTTSVHQESVTPPGARVITVRPSSSPQPRDPQPKQDPSASSSHLPLPNISPDPSHIMNKPWNLVVRNGGPPTSSSSSGRATAPQNQGLTPIQEASGSDEKLAKTTYFELPKHDSVSPLAFSPKSPPSKKPGTPVSAAATTRTDSAPLHAHPHSNTTIFSPLSPRSDVPRHPGPPPLPSPTPPKISARTPTTSALEFWREADESLAPSESASAQPPNYRSEAPPSFWRNADQTLLLHEHQRRGPSMEEWIASLPGLGLGLGPWGNTDGTLDWKMFETLRASRARSRGSGSIASTRAGGGGGGSVMDIIDHNIQHLEHVVEEIEAANAVLAKMDDEEEVLTVPSLALLPPLDEADETDAEDETEAEPEVQATTTDDEGSATPDEEEDSSALANRPPEVREPSLLHPDYRSPTSSLPSHPSLPAAANVSSSWASNGTGSKYLAPIPRRRRTLGRDVASRLDALERYWNEQGVVMGKVLKRMLVVVDNLIVREREEEQRLLRRRQMGWFDEEEEEEQEEVGVQEDEDGDGDGDKSEWQPEEGYECVEQCVPS